jgi:hypothetical protein
LMTFQHVRGTRNSRDHGARPRLTAANGESPLPIRSQNRTQFAEQTTPRDEPVGDHPLATRGHNGPLREKQPCYRT